MATTWSSFRLEYSSLILEVLLIHAANDKERFVGQRTWGPKGRGLEQVP